MTENDTDNQQETDRADAARWRWFRSNCVAITGPLYGTEFRISDSGAGIDVDADDQGGWPAYLDEMVDDQIAGVTP